MSSNWYNNQANRQLPPPMYNEQYARSALPKNFGGLYLGRGGPSTGAMGRNEYDIVGAHVNDQLADQKSPLLPAGSISIAGRVY
ncbi:hypothetical protein LTR09_005686 [Extremus antarcticus]|uniref:Uncharacterized protein n=1 Tax=Extremus antarcticus TaxID=702011 RepID=A0AAJ0GC03_9PEZI|nr:hypothetical protein LTR09_005686 [Extremus antarcticus]